MNIWIVHHNALPPTQAGGTRHYALAKELLRRGHKVTIWASSFNHWTKEERLASRETHKLEVIDGVPFEWIRTPHYRGNSPARVWNMLAFSYRLWQLGRGLGLAKPDVILGSSPPPFAALAAERLTRHFRVPFVLEIRDLWPQTLIDLGSIPPSHPFIVLLDKIERHLYRKASAIVTLLPGAARYMAAKGADPSRVVWIPNGIDLELVPTPSPPQPKEPFTVMYAGAHGLANGLELALEAAHLLEKQGWGKRVRFRFVGNGPEKPNLIRRARELELGNVSFEDPVPKGEVYRLLSQADAFLLILKDSPLFRWGVSPNKLFDFLASARPVLFCVGSPFNPVADANAGMSVPPGDARALTEAVKHLALLSPEERWAMGLRGREYVEQHHAFSRLADKLEGVLQDVVHAAALSHR
jgi:glycosyltransferase involved in cell wall biosynthesis